MKPLSYSRMKMFLACPRQYLLRTENRVQSDLPAIMVRGKFAHAFYERYVGECCTQDSMQCLSEVDDIAEITYKDCCTEAAAKGEPILSPTEWADVVAKLCRPWVERTAIPVDAVEQTESKWAVDFDGNRVDFDADTAFMRGVIDRIDMDCEAFRIVDYKTGWGGTGDPMQADVYAWATFLLTDTRSISVVFEHTANDMREMYTYTRDDFQRIDAAVRSLAWAIQNTVEFHPRPGVACLECPYRYCCDAKAEITEAVETEDDAKRTVEAISLLERDLKTCKEALRRYCDANGNVDHNGVTWGIWKSDGRGFHDAEAFAAACANAQIDPYQYMSVNNLKAKRLQKAFPGIVTENPSLTFRSKKTKGEE
jgi:CRISPR/Cas system-associated exonuclease Cas4 (RecB family)